MSHSPTSSSVVTLGCAIFLTLFKQLSRILENKFVWTKILLGVPHGGSTLKVVEFQRFQNNMLSVV